MIKDKEIIFKNSKIEDLIEKSRQEMVQYNMPTFKAGRLIEGKSVQEQGESIIAGYWVSLLADAMMNRLRVKMWIDFTYDTIERLPYSLSSLFMIQKNNGYTRERNASVIGKTIAAVMYGLAMNEHGYAFSVEMGKIGPLWGDLFSIRINGAQKVDFLDPALRAVGATPIVMQKGLFVDMTPVIQAYKSATGIDLAQYRLANIAISEA